jgi:hypothetical protein
MRFGRNYPAYSRKEKNDMKKVLVIVGLILLAACTYATITVRAQRADTPTAISGANGRYRITSAQIEYVSGGIAATAPTVFLLDSQTGRVWIYQAAASGTGKDGKPFFERDSLAPVSFVPGTVQQTDYPQ